MQIIFLQKTDYKKFLHFQIYPVDLQAMGFTPCKNTREKEAV